MSPMIPKIAVPALMGGLGLKSYIKSLDPIAYWPLDESPAGPQYLTIHGNPAVINCGSDASLDDLPDGSAFTVDMWIAPHAITSFGKFITKADGGGTNGWVAQWDGTAETLQVLLFCTTTSAITRISFPLNADVWRHLTIFYDDAGDRKTYVAVDGVWTASYITQQAGVDAYLSDAANSLLLGNRPGSNQGLDGSYGWVRISDNDRFNHGTDFTPPSRTSIPAVDANTISLWPMNEGYGSVAGDLGANNNDGTITDGSWAAYPAAQEIIHGNNGAYTGVLLGQSQPPFTCPYWDGVNDLCNLYSVDLAARFNPSLGSLSLLVNIDWDGTATSTCVVKLQADNSNKVVWQLFTGTTRITFYYTAGGTGTGPTINGSILDPLSNTWVHLTLTWNKVQDRVRAYLNGSQHSELSGLGTWVGSLSASYSQLMNAYTTPSLPQKGYAAHLAVFDKELTPGEVAAIYAKAGI
jgi:hypothetical protein